MMENKINVAELLKDCPKGMELDCTMYDRVTFNEVTTVIGFDDKKRVKIILSTHYSNGTKDEINLTEFGTYTDDETAKCVIFPKGKTTWEGFVPPVDFKDGDIVAVTMKPEGIWIGIFKQHKETSFESHCCLNTIGEFNSKGLKNHSFIGLRFATEEEKQKLFDAIKENGYRWNSETKTLDKLPIFKVGNKVRHKNNHNVVFTITSIEEDYYACGAKMAFWFYDQNEWELAPNKFDITTLKPFDKVLARCSTLDKWCIQFFEKYNKTYQHPFICMGYNKYKQCIPYEGNEHLHDTNNDCDDFYKIWEK